MNVRSVSRRALLATALALLAPLAIAPLEATSYVMVSDEALVDETSYAVVARVTSVDRSATVAGPDGPGLFTEYGLEVQETLKGELRGRTLRMRLPGGVGPDGIGLKIYGTPRFRVGEQALLFLEPDGQGAYRPAHLMLGAFHKVSAGGRSIAVRNLSEAQAVRITAEGVRPAPEAGRDQLRDFDAFARWVAERAANRRPRADYLVDDADGELSRMAGKATFFEDVDDGYRMRWFAFDTRGNVSWRAYTTGQQGVSGGGYSEFQAGLQAWNSETQTPVDYRYSGKTSSKNGLSTYDTVNSIVFNDPTSFLPAFSCAAGGVLAAGGPWYEGSTIQHRGRRYHRILNADIVVNKGLSCFFASSPNASKAAQELFGHELGHTLGLGHACGDEPGSVDPDCENPLFDDALMRAYVHDDQRGARLNDDDRSGIQELYSATGGAPAAPTDLSAEVLSTTEIRLIWSDNADNETEYRVEVKTTGGTYVDRGSIGANSETADVIELSPATGYSFRIRAKNAGGFSAYSNEVTTATLAPIGACVPDAHTLCLNNGRFKVQIAWETGAGQSGVGSVVTSAADSGLLWFFDANNWEMLVKVLNGCGANNRYWVFFAATTNVEYTMTVIDTQTGAVKVYHNPQGNPSSSVTDTAAFASCS